MVNDFFQLWASTDEFEKEEDFVAKQRQRLDDELIKKYGTAGKAYRKSKKKLFFNGKIQPSNDALSVKLK